MSDVGCRRSYAAFRTSTPYGSCIASGGSRVLLGGLGGAETHSPQPDRAALRLRARALLGWDCCCWSNSWAMGLRSSLPGRGESLAPSSVVNRAGAAKKPQIAEEAGRRAAPARSSLRSADDRHPESRVSEDRRPAALLGVPEAERPHARAGRVDQPAASQVAAGAVLSARSGRREPVLERIAAGRHDRRRVRERPRLEEADLGLVVRPGAG